MQISTRLFVVVALCCFIQSSFAQWSTDPNVNLAISDTTGSQELPKIVTTSDGGCYVSWFDNRAGGYQVYMQRLNAQGVKQWSPQGLLISSNPQSSSLVDYDLAVDDSNNAVLVFTDTRNGGQIEPFAYRINPSGSFLWSANGVALSTSSSTFQPNPKVVATSDGNFVFAWIFSSTPRKVAMQKLNAAGAKQWGTDPIFFAGTGTENLDYPNIVRSDAGNVLLSNSGYTGTFISPTNYRIYARKISPTGISVWNANPDTVYGQGRVSGFFAPKMISDGSNGAFCVWHDDRNGTGSSFSHVQRITSTGAKLFPTDGTAGSTLVGRLHNDAWVAFTPATGETYMFWYETNSSSQNVYGVYGQKFSSNGTRQWSDSGKAIRPFGGGQPSFIRAFGKDSSAVAFYLDGATVTTSLVRGFRIDRNGNLLWGGTIKDVSSNTASKGRLTGALTSNGTSLLAWSDKRLDGNGVYGQNVKLDGSLGAQSRIPAGNVSGSWTRTESPYYIDGEISIPLGSTLTIQPGVQILFAGHYKFNVYGRILAVGTAADTIVFTAQNTTAGWHGLRFYNTNTNGQDSSKFVYCRLEYGKAVSTVNADKEGGAIRLENSSNVQINRCWFRYNYADNDGGAIIARASSNVVIDNSLFSANKAYFYGGAFMCRASSPTIRNSTFVNDTSTIFGAGVSGWDNSVLRLENVKILNCQAGAATGIYTANNTTITVVSSLIAGNSATLGHGGGAGFSVSTPTLINVTMVNNTAAQSGGAAWFYQSTSSVKSSICWTNLPDVFSVDAGSFQCTYSDIFGGYVGTGNINLNPAFLGSGNNPYALQDTSACRNTGNPDTTGLGLPAFDLAGNPRIGGGRIDMGAYEVTSSALSGTKTIGGSSPDYPTIKAAINAVNQLGVQSPGVTFLIRGGTYTEDSLSIRAAGSSASAPIVLKSNANDVVTINVTPPATAYDFAIRIDSTNYVTIDGSGTGTPPARNITVNSLGATGRKGIHIIRNSDNCVVRNVVLSCFQPSTGGRPRTIEVTGSASGNPDNLLIDNVYVKRSGAGVYFSGSLDTVRIQGAVVQNSTFAIGAGDTISYQAVYIEKTEDAIVRNNVIRNLTSQSPLPLGGSVTGILVTTSSPGARVYGNDISKLRSTGSVGVTYGIAYIGTQFPFKPAKIYNNFISDIDGDPAGTFFIYGIAHQTSGTVPPATDTIAYNSVNMVGTGTGLRASAALAYVSGTVGQTVVVKNNILKNTRQEGVGTGSFATALRKGGTAGTILISNNNDLYVGTPDTIGKFTGVIFDGTVNLGYPTLANWRTGSGQDANSIAVNPPFISATNLRIDSSVATTLNGGATPLPGIITDFDGQPRNATTPDIGADEFTPTTAVDENGNLSTDFSLKQNYPNPFNPTTRIKFTVKVSGLTSLKVYDVLGREVATLVNELKQAGRHEVQFDASKLGSGAYFYRLVSGEFSDTKRMLLLK